MTLAGRVDRTMSHLVPGSLTPWPARPASCPADSGQAWDGLTMVSVRFAARSLWVQSEGRTTCLLLSSLASEPSDERSNRFLAKEAGRQARLSLQPM